jgi:DNA polymerase (family 10)
MDKKGVVAVLEEMGTLLELDGANPFKSRAFHNASRAIEGVTDDLRSLVDSGKTTEIKGVGASIAAIIRDLVTTGRSEEHATLRKKFPDGVLAMLRIQGLGPKKVKILYEKLKIRDLDGLEKGAQAHELSRVEGFGAKTEENILKGIVALRSRSEKSLYSVASDSAQRILESMKAQRGALRAEIAGSLRRRKEVIGDIDIVVSAKEADRKRLMDAFIRHPDVGSIIARGETKSSVALTNGIHCDLRIVKDGEYPFALNYFTGSKEHNVEMRTRAKRQGLSLNEYGFSPADGANPRGKAQKAVRCKDETDIYRVLGLAFVPPELRENAGEFEAAEKGRFPALIEGGDIRGTFHCHTTYSDGVNTLEQIAGAARALGWEYLGIGDHSKAAAYAGGLTEAKVKAQIKAIEAINERTKGFRIFKGSECDILADGSLDWPERVLAMFEYVVVSVHSNFTMSEATMTKRIIKALTHRRVAMLGHPTGRLLLSRDPYPVDMKQVIDAAADYGKCIEINAHPMRLDLDWRLCRYAREKGVMLAINPDAHNIEGLRDVYYGVGTARKGWVEAGDVLNTRPVREVAAWMHERMK